MRFELPPLYPITDRYLAGSETHLAIVKELIEGGARLIQIRDKQAAPGQLFADVVKVVRYARRYGAKIIINDRVDIALVADADGVHLGQDDFPVDKARRLLGREKIIGISTHNLDQALQASDAPVDYIAIGPIFATSTKESPNPPVGMGLIRTLRRLIAKPIVAIGGITLESAPAILEAGADSVAVISDLLREKPASKRVRLYLQTLSRVRSGSVRE